MLAGTDSICAVTFTEPVRISPYYDLKMNDSTVNSLENFDFIKHLVMIAYMEIHNFINEIFMIVYMKIHDFIQQVS